MLPNKLSAFEENSPWQIYVCILLNILEFISCYMLSAHSLISVLGQPENAKEGKFTSVTVAKKHDYVICSKNTKYKSFLLCTLSLII